MTGVVTAGITGVVVCSSMVTGGTGGGGRVIGHGAAAGSGTKVVLVNGKRFSSNVT